MSDVLTKTVMILVAELKSRALVRLKDAEVLAGNKCYDGAVYICGYAVEFALKARICRTLKWDGFPDINAEFQLYQSLKTHDLNVLLHLSGVEAKVKSRYEPEWGAVSFWNPEMRYRLTGTTAETAKKMTDAARIPLRYL